MRTTLWLIMCLFISGMYTPLYSQAEKKPTIDKVIIKGTYTLKRIFDLIYQQTKQQVTYSNRLLNDQERVALQINGTVDEALTAALSGKEITWVHSDGYVSLQQKKSIPISSINNDPITVSGTITDQEGNPLVGATVKAGGKTTATGDNGRFVLRDIEKGTVLEISYIGYESMKVKVSFEYLSIALQTASSDLQEVVVNKGYYSTSKELNTGSVSVVSGAELVKGATGDPLIALEGRVPGLYVAQTSGVAGAAVDVMLRGRNSLSNGNNPLYIVDGIPFNSSTLTLGNGGGAAVTLSPFAGLNVNNIKSIEVLKDADATAIYGSRGANGVILITTKKANAGKATLNVNVYSGTGRAASKLDLMNTQEYLQMRRKAFANDGITTTPTDPDLNGEYGNVNKFTDWQKVFIGGTASITDVSASISGGSDKTQFLIGGGYRKETTVFPGNYFDRKASFNANMNHHEGKLKSNLSISYLNDNNQLASTDFTSKILLAPNAPDLYTPDKKLNWQNSVWENPLWVTTTQTKTLTETFNSSLSIAYEWTTGLSTHVRAGYNNAQSHSNVLNPFINYDPTFEVTPEYRSNLYGDNRIQTWIIEPGITYNLSIRKGKIESLIGGTFQQSDQKYLSGTAYGFSSPEVLENIAAATNNEIGSFNDIRYRYNAVYARLAYNYRNQYLVNFTGRRDASSRFGPGRQFANLGAIGAAWIFSKQAALRSILPVLSYGKIRGSYGITGNDQLADYEYLSTYTPGSRSYQSNGGLVPTSLTNPKYGWETVKKLELGLEFGLNEDQFMLNINWYRNRTGNQLVGYALPSITGFTSVRANLPAVIQNSGTEIDFTAQILKTSEFKWAASANLSIPKNKLLSYPNIEASSYSSRYVVGQPLFIRFFYNNTGKDLNKNQYIFEDRNNDGQISGQADRVPAFIGQKYFGGISNTFTYKGVQLDVFFQFVKQTGYKFLYTVPGSFDAQYANQAKALLPKETSGEIQRFTQVGGSDLSNAFILYMSSNGMIQDASFIRLKNLTLSWSLPHRILQSLRMKSLSVFARGQNLLTLTRFDGFDPETGGTSQGTGQLNLPPLRTITAGIQLSL